MAKVKGPWGQEFEVADPPVNNDPPANDPPVNTDPPKVDPPVNTDPPANDPPADTKPQIIEVEKIVEVIKEVEKPHTFTSDAARELYEQMTAGNEDALKSYLDEKYRNYDTMSDLDVVRWQLKKDNPDWKDKDVDLEIKGLYGKTLEKIDIAELVGEDLEKANEKNELIEERIDKLLRDARDARIKLNKQKTTIELPKITKPETQQNTKKEPTAAEIATQQADWERYTEEKMKDLSDFKWNVEGEEVSYNFTDSEKKSLLDEMKWYNAAESLTKLGWRDNDGNLFPDKIAKDMHIIRNIDKLINTAFTQGKTAGKEDTVVKDIKNLNLKPGSTQPNQPNGVDVWQRMSQRLYGNN